MSIQSLLPYERTYEDGTMKVGENYYTKTVEFFDINYSLAPVELQKKIFNGYCHFLNHFDERMHVQITFVNSKADKNDILDVISVPNRDDNLKELRDEYAAMLRSQYAKGNNGISRRKYITIGTHMEAEEDAIKILDDAVKAIKANLSNFGVVSKTLNGREYLKVMYTILNPGINKEFSLNSRLIGDEGRKYYENDKDDVAPKILEFYGNNTFRMGNRYCMQSSINLKASDFLDNMLIDCLKKDEAMVVALSIKPINMSKSTKYVREKMVSENAKKIDKNKQALNDGFDIGILPPGLQANIDGCQEYYDGLTKESEKLFYVSMGYLSYGKDLNELKTSNQSIAKDFISLNNDVYSFKERQIDGLKSVLPVCHDEIGKARTLLTTHLGMLIPFTSQELFMKGESSYYGLNPLSNNMIMCDKKQLASPNTLILGKTGSGKSFSTKREILNAMLISDDDVIICDPEAEYLALVKNGLNGQIITISSKSRDHINPMEVNLDVYFHPEIYDDPNNNEREDVETLIKDKFEFMCSFCEMICCSSSDRGKQELTGEEISAIDAATKNVYEKFFENGPSLETMPILEDFFNELSRIAYMEEKEARFEGIPENVQIAAACIVGKMRTYIKGSNDIFNHRTNIDLDNRVVCFNIKNLGINLRKIGMFIIQNMVWTRVSKNRIKKKYTRFYIDEFHLLLAQPQTAQYSVEIWKRFRKYGGIPVAISQDVTDLLISTQVENIFSNTDFIIMLNQAEGDRKILCQKLGISKDQENYITNANQGEGLLYYGGIIIPFVDKYPTNTKSYKLMSTKLGESV